MGAIDTGAGKGSEWRPVDKKKYDECPLWKNMKKARLKREKEKEHDKK